MSFSFICLPGEVYMKRFVIIPSILFISFWAALLNADIYSWTDEKGVQHFTNYDPPKQAKLMIKAAQFTTDEKAVQEQIEAKRLERQQLELEEVAQKQTLISLKQQALEEQLDAADRRAEEAEEALKRYKEIYAPGYNDGYDDLSDGGDDVEVTVIPYRYYPHYSYRGYFNHRSGHYFRKRHFGHTGKRHFRHFNRHRFGSSHHAKGRHDFKGRGHHFTKHFRGGQHSRTNFRGGQHSKAHFRGGHRSRSNFRGGHRSMGHFRGGQRGSRR